MMSNHLFKVTLIIVILLFPSGASAQSYQVQPIQNFSREYQDKHRIIFDYINEHPEWTLEQRTNFYENEMAKLKNEFRAVRKAEYESKSIQLSVTNSCTSKSSGGKKNCGWNCIDAPITDLYTQKAWIYVKGDNKGVKTPNDGRRACLKMTVAGKGKNKGRLFATFKYHPDRVLALLNADTNTLFSQIN